MKRTPEQLCNDRFDVVVVGAGIQGATIARDAAMRGLKVALIDKGDLCGGTSHNSLKTIHGGIRYLQHLNFKRTLESIREQHAWLRIAPHLVRPLRFLMPTYGHGMRGPEAMRIGLALYSLLKAATSLGDSKTPRLPGGAILSRKQCLDEMPGNKSAGLTGGAVWYDTQVVHADQAVIENARAATDHGAVVCNYVAAEELLYQGDSVCGLRATDRESGQSLRIESRIVVNATGPWAARFLQSTGGGRFADARLPLTQSMNIVTRPLFGDSAVCILSSRASDSVVGKTRRLYFVTPWQGYSVIGTTHFPYGNDPDDMRIEPAEVQAFINEVNNGYPDATLTLDDVLYCHKGLTPGVVDSAGNSVSRSHQSTIEDHAKTDGIEGVISVVPVKYTTARLVAEKTVDRLFRKLGRRSPPCRTAYVPLGRNGRTDYDIDHLSMAAYIEYCEQAARDDMAVRLTDLLLRRMSLVARGLLTGGQLESAVDAMSRVHGWSAERRNKEKADFNDIMRKLRPSYGTPDSRITTTEPA